MEQQTQYDEIEASNRAVCHDAEIACQNHAIAMRNLINAARAVRREAPMTDKAYLMIPGHPMGALIKAIEGAEQHV